MLDRCPGLWRPAFLPLNHKAEMLFEKYCTRDVQLIATVGIR